MIDFAKLNDPAYQKQIKAEQAAKSAELQAQQDRWKSATTFCLAQEGLDAKERTFLQSIERHLLEQRQLSEKQEKWLFDIEARLMPTTYVSVSHGVRGYFAVLIETDENGFAMPVESGIGSFSKKEGAIREGKSWAQAEGILFIN